MKLAPAAALLLSLTAISTFGATGDVGGAWTDTRGWVLYVRLMGMATNGTINTGWSSNKVVAISTPKVSVSVNDLGYSTNNTPQYFADRVIYAGESLRYPWPSDSFRLTIQEGTNVIIGVSLSEYIYQNSSNLLANISPGLYVAGGITNNSASNVVVTNNSTQAENVVKLRWMQPGWQWITSGVMSVSARISHPHWKSDALLPYVRFIFSTNGVVATNVQPTLNLLSYKRTPAKSLIYTAQVPATLLGPSNVVRIDAYAAPWVGSTNSVLDTRKNTYSGFGPGPMALTNFVDIGANYSRARFVVDQISGNDSTGKVFNDVAVDSIASTNFFKTPGVAWSALAASNNIWFGHNDYGGGIGYYRAGTSNLTGSTITTTAIPKTYAFVVPYPGDSVTLTSGTGTDSVGPRTWVQDMTMGYVSGQTGFNACESLVISNATINAASTLWASPDGQFWLIDPLVIANGQDLGPVTTDTTVWNITGMELRSGINSKAIIPALLAGTWYNDATPSGYRINNSQIGWGGYADWTMIVDNLFYNMAPAGDAILLGNSTNTLYGFDFSNNLCESVTNNFEGPNILFCATQRYTATGIIFDFNTILGKRHGIFYADTADENPLKSGNFVRGNIFDPLGIKTDTLPGSQSSARTNNWSIVWGVGMWLNARLDRRTDQGAGAYLFEWVGLNSYQNPTTTNTIAFPKFVNDNAYDGGTSVGEGYGNYHLRVDSPLYQELKIQGSGGFVVSQPYDVLGELRTIGVPGAFKFRAFSLKSTSFRANSITINN